MQNGIIFVIVACAVVFLVHRYIKRRGGCGCACDSGNGGQCSSCIKCGGIDGALHKRHCFSRSGQAENVKKERESKRLF